jgi:hypothetical protein
MEYGSHFSSGRGVCVRAQWVWVGSTESVVEDRRSIPLNALLKYRGLNSVCADVFCYARTRVERPAVLQLLHYTVTC